MRSKPVLISVFFSSVILMLSCIHVDTRNILPFKTSYDELSNPTKAQVTCLAKNIYFEAAHEPVDGWKAVAFVTVNRVQSGYGEDICSVVKQKTNGTCQFTWYCERNTEKDLTIHDKILYNEILELATNLVVNYDKMKDITDGSTYYHASYVQPGWTKMEKVIQIGNHIFYRSKRDRIDRNKEFI